MSDKKDNRINTSPNVGNLSKLFEGIDKSKVMVNIPQIMEVCTVEMLLNELTEGTDATVKVDMFQPVISQARITVQSKNVDFSNNKLFKEAVANAKSVEVVQNDETESITILFDGLVNPIV